MIPTDISSHLWESYKRHNYKLSFIENNKMFYKKWLVIKKEEGENIINIYSTKSINLITFFISVTIFLILNLLISFFTVNNSAEANREFSSENTISEKKIQESNNQNEKENRIDNEKIEEINQQEYNWYIEIPAISLKAPINESINMEILDNFVGHFEETSKTDGNIGLAGHNRGYKNNYFENINKLIIGDEIKYKCNEFEKSYVIEKIEKIKNTNWSYLENSEQNK